MVDFFRLNVIVLFICGVKNKTMEFSHSRTEARLKISIGVFEILDLQPLSVSHKKIERDFLKISEGAQLYFCEPGRRGRL